LRRSLGSAGSVASIAPWLAAIAPGVPCSGDEYRPALASAFQRRRHACVARALRFDQTGQRRRRRTPSAVTFDEIAL